MQAMSPRTLSTGFLILTENILELEAGTAHRLVHLDRLGDEECVQGYAINLSNRFTALNSLADAAALWKSSEN